MKRIRITAAALFAATLAGAASAASTGAPAAPAAMAEQAAPAAADGEGSPDAGPGRPGPRFGPHMAGPGLHFLRGIELSEAQQDRVFAIMHAQAPQLREQEKAERKAHEALRAMMDAGRYDEAKAAAQTRALGQAVATRELLRVRAAAQVMALLTPQQKEELARERGGERGPRAPRR